MAFPASLTAYTPVVDDVDIYRATHINSLQTGINNLETQVGVGGSAPTALATPNTYVKRDANGFAQFQVKSAKAYANANVSIATAGSWKPIPFTNTTYDVGTWFNIANPNYITVPTTGLVTISAVLQFAANATGFRKMAINIDGAVVAGEVTGGYFLGIDIRPAHATENVALNATVERQLAAGAKIYLVCNQNSGGALNTLYLSEYSQFLTAKVS